MSQALRSLLLVVLVLFSVGGSLGCGTRKSTYSSPQGIERPATSLDEEKDVGDRAGEVLVAIVVVGTAIALIAVPILLILLL